MGLETMLFGVSGSCDDMDATSLPVELEPGPPSEKLTCGDMKQRSEAWTGQSSGGAAAAQSGGCVTVSLSSSNGNKIASIYSVIKANTLVLFRSNIDIEWMESA